MGIVLKLNDDLYINPDQIACIEIVKHSTIADHGVLFSLIKRDFQVILSCGKKLTLDGVEEGRLRNYYYEQDILLSRDQWTFKNYEIKN